MVHDFCATAEPSQHVAITAQEEVVLELHFPRQRLASPQADIYELTGTRDPPNASRHASRHVATIAHGSHISLSTQRGTQFKVIEAVTGREVSTFTASAEALQRISIGRARFVTLEFVSSRALTRDASLYKVWDDEHHVAEIAPGHTRRATSAVGEAWVVRESYTDKLLLAINASDEPFQRITIEPAGLASSSPDRDTYGGTAGESE